MVKVNFKKLINEIIISPSSTDWFVELVKNIVNRYGLDELKVYKSKIYDKIDD